MCGVQFWTISWLVLSSWKVTLQERRTFDFCRRSCPYFWRMGLWINEVICISNMTELLLIFQVKLEIFWTIVSLGDGGPHNWPTRSPDLSPLDYCVWGWMIEQVYSVNTRCIAWSHYGCCRPHEKQSAEAATSNSHSSQPSGSLCCGGRWHFRKPALSTDKFKLKVTSPS